MAKLHFRFKTPKDIRNSIARVNNMVANGEMDTKIANAIICGCNTQSSFVVYIKIYNKQKKRR